MELRELRRLLYYNLQIDQSVHFRAYTIRRTEPHLVVEDDARVRRFAVGLYYQRVGDDVLAFVAADPATTRSAKGRKRIARSQYRGVSVNPACTFRPWLAQVYVGNNRSKFVGQFPTEEAAARAYDAYVLAHGLDKPLNFPAERAVS